MSFYNPILEISNKRCDDKHFDYILGGTDWEQLSKQRDRISEVKVITIKQVGGTWEFEYSTKDELVEILKYLENNGVV